MKNTFTKSLGVVATWLAVTAALSTCAATFDSGSDGSFGSINIPYNTDRVIEVPTNGIIHCTTVYIDGYSTLYFKANALNTPVYLLATGDIVIRGQISVAGSTGSGTRGGIGGPGGFPGGMGGIAGGHTAGGDGAGPGGGKSVGGWQGGSFAYPVGSNSNMYGNALLFPILGGSGGAGKDAASGGYGGGGGGGAIVIASNTRIDLTPYNTAFPNGRIGAPGGNGAYEGNVARGGGGSGGAIRLVAPVITGTGVIDTSGGFGGYLSGSAANYNNHNAYGSSGRIRIDTLDDYSYRSLTFGGAFSRGTRMFVFRTNAPRLDLLEVADSGGTNRTMIPLGTTSGISIELPFGAPTNQVVKLRAEYFTNDVPVRIVVTPDTGPALTYDGVVPTSGNAATNSFNVTIPAGTVSRIDAWTR